MANEADREFQKLWYAIDALARAIEQAIPAIHYAAENQPNSTRELTRDLGKRLVKIRDDVVEASIREQAKGVPRFVQSELEHGDLEPTPPPEAA